MRVAIHQPNYFPYLGYFHKMANCDVFVILDDVDFAKRSYTQRTKISTPTGEAWLTIPVLTKDRGEQRISDVEIDNTQPWARKHWRTLLHSYQQARHFSSYSDSLAGTYEGEHRWLAELNVSLIRRVADLLGVATPLVKASSLKVEGKRTDRIIDICRKLGADGYVSGKSGRDYMDEGKVAEANILLYYQDFQHPVYQQVHGEFKYYMSILDLLFNCGEKSGQILLKQGNIALAEASVARR